MMIYVNIIFVVKDIIYRDKSMKTIIDIINSNETKIDLSAMGEYDKCVFIDIETTGLSADTSYIYEVGTAYLNEETGNYEIKQWLISQAREERNMLYEVIAFLRSFKKLVHFNGNTFDIPFIQSRCKACGIACDFSDYEGIDIYRRVSSLKHFLKLDNCKQKSVENFIGIDREDEYTGKDLIKVYRDYSENLSEENEKLLLLHNHDDVLGLLKIVPVLSYNRIFNDGVVIKKVQTNVYNDVFGLSKKELILTIGLPCEIPAPINYNAQGCYFSAKGCDGIIKVPLLHEELKFFYTNYHDYYYLPEEDIAVHKSVAEYVDKDFREQAKASNCYTRKVSDYLPQWDKPIFEPFFRRDYDSSCIFFELTDSFKSSKESFNKYSNHILNMMYNCR